MKWREKWNDFLKANTYKGNGGPFLIRKFLQEIEEKLDRGAAEYGDSTFEMTLRDVVRNIKEESVDLVGWTYFYWLNNRDKTEDDRMAINGLLYSAELAWGWCQKIEDRLHEKTGAK